MIVPIDDLGAGISVNMGYIALSDAITFVSGQTSASGRALAKNSDSFWRKWVCIHAQIQRGLSEMGCVLTFEMTRM